MRLDTGARVLMNRIVERCPTCGVEHEDDVHECEACGGPLRYWCREHSRDAGWLDGPICPRCDPLAAHRPAPSPLPAPAPPPSAAPGRSRRAARAVAPPPVHADEAPVDEEEMVPTAPGAPGEAPDRAAPDPPETRYEGPSELLRRRLAEIEALEKKLLDLPAPAAPSAVEPAAGPISDTIAVAPAAGPAPMPEPAPATPRRGIFARIYDAVLTVTWTGILFTLAGVALGAGHAMIAGIDVPETAAVTGILGAVAGLALGGCIVGARVIRFLRNRKR